MKLRCVCLVAAVVLLSGCSTSDWDSSTLFPSFGQSDQVASSSAPEPADTAPMTSLPVQANSDDTFCRGVGKSDAEIAAGYGLRDPDLGRIAERGYRQCLAKSVGRLH